MAVHLKPLVARESVKNAHLVLYVEALIKSGDPAKAIRELHALRPKFSSKIEWLLLMSKALQKLGRIDQAIETIQSGLGRKKQNRRLIKRLAQLAEVQTKALALEQEYKSSETWRRLQKLRNTRVGQRCFIIGNGPSLLKQDLKKLTGEFTFVTNWFSNHPDCKAIQPKYYCIASHTVFGGWSNNVEHSLDKTFKTKLLENAPDSHIIFSYRFKPLLDQDPDFLNRKLDYLLFDNPKRKIYYEGGFNPDLSGFQYNGFTGILTFCIPLAIYMGFSEIYLVGCDCDYQLESPEKPKSYFYKPEQHTTLTTRYENLCFEWAPDGPVFKSYEAVKAAAAKRGVRIFNATAGGKLEVFDRVPFESLFPTPS
jgi:tetratricopeptide (TPR) repeat protein